MRCTTLCILHSVNLTLKSNVHCVFLFSRISNKYRNLRDLRALKCLCIDLLLFKQHKEMFFTRKDHNEHRWIGCPAGCLKTNHWDQNANRGLHVHMFSEFAWFEKCVNNQWLICVVWMLLRVLTVRASWVSFLFTRGYGSDVLEIWSPADL